jgi:hypothetical protein
MERRHYGLRLFLAFLIPLWLSTAVYADDIDVMIVFDNTAKTWVDTHGGMNAFATDAVAKMNQAMTNSNVDLTFHLVHAAQVNYNHSGDLETDLVALQAGTGNLSDVHTWRDTYAADLVAMLVDTGSAYGYTGIGYLLTNISGMPAYAFSVNSIRAVEISHTMTHEVGHHSKNQTSDPGPNTYLNTYSAGWYFTGTNTNDYHTIMAYNNDGHGNFYQPAPLFSTRLITFQGTAAGDAADGDNARTIRETMGVVSGYRAGTEQAGRPPWITVPSSSTTGSYTVSWGASSTSGVTYVLQEATKATFSTGLRTAYSGASTKAPITGRSAGKTYYYRVKATKAGYADSAWMTGSNGCAVSSMSLPVTENFNASTLPTGWTTQNTGAEITERWSVSNTANAGGSAYEMICSWQNVNPGTTRLITPWINTLGMDQITLSFRHFFSHWDYGPYPNLRVQTSNNKSTWTNTSWSIATSIFDIGPATVTVPITTNLNSSTTYIAFVVEGNLAGFLYWHVDNVSIRSPILHVSKDVNCRGKRPCYTTIRAAVNAAEAGDTIKVTQGTYNEVPERSTGGTVAIKGGYDSTFTSQTGTTEMYAPGAEGGGGIKVQPNVRVIAP